MIFEHRCDDSRGSSDDDETCRTVTESFCTTRYVEKTPGFKSGGGNGEKKIVADTKCEKVPVEICGKSKCKLQEGDEECHEEVRFGISDKFLLRHKILSEIGNHSGRAARVVRPEPAGVLQKPEATGAETKARRRVRSTAEGDVRAQVLQPQAGQEEVEEEVVFR